MTWFSRRQFLKCTSIAVTAIGPARHLLAAAKQSSSPNEKLRCAVIGVRGRGMDHAAYYAGRPDCEVVCICDADADIGRQRAKQIAERQGGRVPKVFADMRRIFDDKAVDVVSVATPNHWHSLAAIWAMQAGKDVYVEKPVSHNVSEGRRVVQVARKYGRICQAGTQHRGDGSAMAAIQYIREGKLGEVKLARAIMYRRRLSIGPAGSYSPPADVDYNLWAGPAPMAPITRKRFHYDWHWFWDFGNGELGNNGIHVVDMARWGLGLTGLGRAVMSYGGRFGYEDAAETPNTQVVIHDYGDKTIVQEIRGLETPPYRIPGTVFYGTEGILGIQSSVAQLFDPQGKPVRRFEGPNADHFDNFLQAVRSRKSETLRADILEGHTSSALCHLGNISYRLGRPASAAEMSHQLESQKTHEDVMETFGRVSQHLAAHKIDTSKASLTLGAWLTIDSDRESFIDNPRADAFLTREYRKPFVVPEAKDI